MSLEAIVFGLWVAILLGVINQGIMIQKMFRLTERIAMLESHMDEEPTKKDG